MVTTPGDVVLFEAEGWVGRAIYTAQRVVHKKRHARYVHAALVVGEGGELIEAAWAGVVRSNLADYCRRPYVVVPTNMEPRDASQAIAFAESVLASRYGYLTLVGVIVSAATNSRIVFRDGGAKICSGLVAEALCRGEYIWPTPPAYISPADLAALFMGGGG